MSLPSLGRAGKLRMGVKGMDRIIVTQPRHSKVANSASYTHCNGPFNKQDAYHIMSQCVYV
jgi:hypothetical protein